MDVSMIPLDYATLRVIWWLLLGVLLIGFAVMDGFDLGVAALSGVLVAATWYYHNLVPVWDYLTNYGYSDRSAYYGADHSVVSWGRLRSVTDRIATLASSPRSKAAGQTRLPVGWASGRPPWCAHAPASPSRCLKPSTTATALCRKTPLSRWRENCWKFPWICSGKHSGWNLRKAG